MQQWENVEMTDQELKAKLATDPELLEALLYLFRLGLTPEQYGIAYRVMFGTASVKVSLPSSEPT